MASTANNSYASGQTVRRFFTGLGLHGRPRSALANWYSTPVATFFTALHLEAPALNLGQQPCGEEVVALGDLFANINW
jgi:hypothetical protein